MVDLELNEGLNLDEPEEPRKGGGGSKLVWFALFLALLGLAAGGVGLYTARQTERAMEDLRRQMSEESGAAASLEAKLSEFDERLVRVGSETVRIDKQVRTFRDQTQTAFDSVSREVGVNRQNLSRMAEQVTELASRPAPAPAPVVNTTPARRENAATPDSGSSGSPGGSVYQVQAGDTLGKIARDNGYTLTEILNANPGIDPRRLQIGQVVNLP